MLLENNRHLAVIAVLLITAAIKWTVIWPKIRMTNNNSDHENENENENEKGDTVPQNPPIPKKYLVMEAIISYASIVVGCIVMNQMKNPFGSSKAVLDVFTDDPPM